MMELSIQECNAWLSDMLMNPTTGKSIKEGGKTWLALKSTCLQFVNNREGNEGGRIFVKDQETAEKVKEVLVNDSRNYWKIVSRIGDSDLIVVSSNAEGEKYRAKGGNQLIMDLKAFKSVVGIGSKNRMAEGGTEALCKQWRENPLRNPKTGRPIKEGGKVWKELGEMCKPYEESGIGEGAEGKKKGMRKKVVFISPKEEEKGKPGLLDQIEEMCLNHEDPVTFEAWKDMNEEELGNVVMLGSEKAGKKYCLTLDTAYNIYKTAIESGKPERARNPIAMDRTFTAAEISDILAKMRAKDPNFQAPVQDVPVLRPGIELVMQDSMVPMLNGHVYHFVYITVVDTTLPVNRRVLLNYGCVPGWVETVNVGSADYTSGVLLTNLLTLWNDRKFFVKYAEPYTKAVCTVSHLKSKKPLAPADWLHKSNGRLKRQSFIELCQEVTDALNA